MIDSIYVLKLEHGCYFIGKTIDIDNIIIHHTNGCVEWTKMHKPMYIEKIIQNNTMDNIENDTFLEYIVKYGINNVRGNLLLFPTLSENEEKILTKYIRKKLNLCYKCGKSDHYFKDCGLTKKTCQFTSYCGKKIGWAYENEQFDIGFTVDPMLIIELINKNQFRIKNPTTNLYVDADFKTCEKELSTLFEFEDFDEKTGETFIKVNGKYLQADKTWLGHNLRKDSTNKGAWEKITVHFL